MPRPTAPEAIHLSQAGTSAASAVVFGSPVARATSVASGQRRCPAGARPRARRPRWVWALARAAAARQPSFGAVRTRSSPRLRIVAVRPRAIPSWNRNRSASHGRYAGAGQRLDEARPECGGWERGRHLRIDDRGPRAQPGTDDERGTGTAGAHRDRADLRGRTDGRRDAHRRVGRLGRQELTPSAAARNPFASGSMAAKAASLTTSMMLPPPRATGTASGCRATASATAAAVSSSDAAGRGYPDDGRGRPPREHGVGLGRQPLVGDEKHRVAVECGRQLAEAAGVHGGRAGPPVDGCLHLVTVASPLAQPDRRESRQASEA